MIDLTFQQLLQVRTFRFGLVLMILGASPLLVGFVLNAVGLVDIGNGLGLGLVFAFISPPALVLLIVGAVLASRKQRGPRA